MSIVAEPGATRRRPFPHYGDADSFRDLPARRPAEPAAPSSRVQWSRRDLDQYEVTRSGRTLGYVDVVGAVYVALVGPRADRAVEVAQTLVFEDAIHALVAAKNRE